MKNKKLIKYLGFSPKDGATGVYIKSYPKAGGYALEIDLKNEKFDYGKLIEAERETTLNFSQPENWVVFECVNRLLEQGYDPQNIILEKSYPVGRGSNIYLDILVTKKDGSAFLMIECKNAGLEYSKELKKLNKNGGQLFSYFQQDRSADYLMVYTSEFQVNGILFHNEIIKIENEYRQADNVKDFYEVWNKLTKNNGILEDNIAPYHFESKALTPMHLKDITQEDSSKIFNRFLEILRHNVVSDKPNAFNKIFTLFLCKIYDEKSTLPNAELKFQWLEGRDDNVSFQKRLTDLYAKGMEEFLEKEVTDFSDDDFDNTFGNDIDEKLKERLLKQFTRIRLEKNNEFAIKEVFDHASFEDNGKVVKEVVELLQNYKIRYTKKQQYLSDFFELLLTTGLKQESGQFFTPVPVAQFVIRSLPIDTIVKQKLEAGKKNDILPTLIDYASGSGHFLTESMHIIQELINNVDSTNFIPDTKKKLKSWKEDHFEWADQYIYGIEKDYRLVKVGKVGCYLHGDGIANVVHSDGLGNFENTKEYTRALKKIDSTNPQDNRQFDMVVSNPPYSVSAFRNNARKYYTEKDFELYNALTDQSSEIECLFIERTKQLLKDGGVAGIILPSSVLSNGGIYIKAREIILKHFDIIGITELGSNTFMATGTNTATLFLRRKNIRLAKDIENSVNSFANNLQDNTVNGIENPVAKYVSQVWEELPFDDYKTIFQNAPNDAVKNHEIYKEYTKKIKLKDDALLTEITDREKEKILYFILAYSQTVVLIKSGEKKAEKAFLGYEFSNRRGSEGIHPIQRGKSIDECTKLYDANCFDNTEKASTYIYDAFANDYSREIDESLKENVRRFDLVDMLSFDRVEFDKSMSLAVKKKVKIESQWDVVALSAVCDKITDGSHNPPPSTASGYPMLSARDINEGLISFDNPRWIDKAGFEKENKRTAVKPDDVLLTIVGAIGRTAIIPKKSFSPFTLQRSVAVLKPNNELILASYLSASLSLSSSRLQIKQKAHGVAQKGLYLTDVKSIKIPLPPKDIQEKIVAEIAVLEDQEGKAKDAVEELLQTQTDIINDFSKYPKINLGNYSENLDRLRKPVIRGDRTAGEYPYYGASGIVDYVSGYVVDDDVLLVAEDGANLKSRNTPIAIPASGKIWVNNHAHILRFEQAATQVIVEKYLNATDIIEFITGQAQPKLNQQNLNRIPVPNIPFEEQKQIVKKIEKIEMKIAKLESYIASIPVQKDAILRKYL